MTPGARAAVVCAALASAPGCAFFKALLSSFREPTLTFRSAEVREVSLEGLTLDVQFDLTNPNPVGGSVSTVAYALRVEGHEVASGSPPAGLSVPANGRTVLSFPARVRFAELAPTLAAVLSRDQASWQASGRIGVRTPIGELVLPVERSGTFPVPKAPRVQLGNPRIAALSITGARLVLPLQVTNVNQFALPVAVSGSVAIAGSPVAQIGTGSQPALAAGESRRMDVPVDVNFVHAGLAVANALRAGHAQVALTGRVDSGGASVPLQIVQDALFQR